VILSLGFSHPVEYKLPEGITAKVDKNLLIVSGVDRQAVGAAAAKIRSFRPPEPYKGKGIKYVEETIIRKAGKTAGK
jgi:large subunit ribosomal protein L6